MGLLGSQNMASQTTLDAVKAETDKIDAGASDGLIGTADSTAYRAHEGERHMHSYERWFETAATPSGETHVADLIGSGSGAFRLDADNDDWGTWVQLLGSSDTPSISGSTHYDPHRIHIEAAEREATYFIQLAFGATGDGALSAGTYTSLIYVPLTNKKEPLPVVVQTRRQVAGTKTWARTKCPGQNTATLDLYPGIHEYEG